ncbi:MAG: HlyD family type I secretion periplasmic adaptor subunit [Desulfotignum sp.]|nr:HlyD family type I secretion periplasmic adaptor subunit [Desulfotignum sp.]
MEEQDRKLNTNPWKYIVAGLVIIALFFGGLAVWSVYFPFQGAIIAPGLVKVSGKRKVVQHLEGGIVDKIHVRDGDRVKKGDVLIELKDSRVSSNLQLLINRLWFKKAEAARLRAEAGMKSEITWPPEFAELTDNSDMNEILASQQDIFDTRRKELQGKTQLYLSQIKQLGNQIGGAKEELQSVEEIIKNLEEDLASKRPLLKEKYLGKTNILELERSLSQYKGRKGKLIQEIAQYQQMIEEKRLQILDIENQYRESSVTQFGEVTDVIFELEEQIKPQLDASERLKILAPISGVVINTEVHSEDSGVIYPRMNLLEIVPEDSQLIVVARVRPQDIASVKQGQHTKVQLAAFQRKSTPPVEGRVIYVSPDLVEEEDQRQPPYYETQVEVNREDLNAKGAYLTPGMPVTCYITTDERTVISYLLGPLLKNIDTAMRE